MVILQHASSGITRCAPRVTRRPRLASPRHSIQPPTPRGKEKKYTRRVGSGHAASGSPLGGCVGVQHSGALHPCPNRVHPGHHGLLFHTTPTPLDALVDAKHQNAPSTPPLSLSLLSLPLAFSPPLLSSLLLPRSPLAATSSVASV